MFWTKPPTDDLARELHEHFDLDRPEVLTPPDDDLLRLRWRLIKSEYEEVNTEFENLLAAKRFQEQHAVMMDLAKEFADLRTVLEGAAVSFGIDLEAVYREVHRSNMTKQRAKDGGKLVKGDAYSPADVEAVLGCIIEGQEA